jgi:cytidylate kinase
MSAPTERRLTIAMDGPGSAGKGTVAKGVARKLGYQYIDTGAMYRSVALKAYRQGVDWDDESSLTALVKELAFVFEWDGDMLRIRVNGIDVTSRIRAEEIGVGASRVSRLPGVRQGLLELQRELGSAGGVVMDGRDIGTVVLPDADLKIYIDASLDVRARRRHEELLRRGEAVHFETVKATLLARDSQDMGRAIAPLKKARDAHFVDTTDMSIPQAIQAILTLVAACG